MTQRYVEGHQIVPAIVPVNLATAANAGDWVSMKYYDRCAVCVFCAAGAAGEPPEIKLQQAKAVAGTSAKDLLFTRIWKKVGALSDTGEYTLVEQAAATSFTDTGEGDHDALYNIEIESAMLDADNDFDCVQVSIADVGATAHLGCAWYDLYNAKHQQAILPSAIAD